ncbi:MAG: immune inhibitor A [Chloroflexota bacterium]|nr:immune inhibitor A [Chloroflexota bacterium]
MNRTLATLVAATTLLAAASCCCCCGDFNWDDWSDWEWTFEPTLTFNTPAPPFDETPTPEVTPVITREPVGDVGAETEELLETTKVPVRDLHDLAIRLRGLPPDTPRTINPEGSPDYPVGTRRLFHVSNVDTDEQFDIHAILEYKTEHVYMWVEEGARFDRDDLEDACDLFEDQTYFTDRDFFGSEWSPGVDNDPHLSILHARGLGNTVAGYYSSADEFVSAVRDDSNELEMFYINIENVTINDSFYNGVLAHEFQHMIHWYNDRNEETWLNEGFSELAMYLNGFDVGGHDWIFANTPDTQLNSWPEGPGAAGANYGAGYLFTSYFLDRFGPSATQSLVAHPENSLASVGAVLEELGAGLTYEDLFADWIVANLLDDPYLADGRYGYEEIDPPSFEIETSYDGGDYPASGSSTVHQHGNDYIELRGEQPLDFSFTGSTQIGLVNTTAHSGSYFWWSNRGDDSDMMLTRGFDLSNVSEATLEFWTWYDLEEDWDYAYVEISADGGETWEILTTPSGTRTNPNGNSFGWAYTGRSGGGGTAEWIHEQVDLSPYAGQEVLIRFEYITDDAVNRPGFILDDVAIPEIDYSSDFEEDEDEWETAGFIRHANVLPQRWLVQLILFGRETTVQRLELDEDQTGEWVIPLEGRTDRAVITISGLAPVTTEMGSYSYEIEEQ